MFVENLRNLGNLQEYINRHEYTNKSKNEGNK
jgi:hypothetical protein